MVAARLPSNRQDSVTPLSETTALLWIHLELLTLHIFKTHTKCFAECVCTRMRACVPLASSPLPHANHKQVTGTISLKYNQKDATFSQSIYFYKLLYIFQAVPPPIIRSTKLYIQRQVLSNQHCCRHYLLQETCRAVYRNKQIEKMLHLVGCTLEIYLWCTHIWMSKITVTTMSSCL
jgi:hypothetical protein